MTTINTSLYCRATQLGGQLHIPPDAGVASMAQLGLLVGMADPVTREVPTDLQGLKDAARRLDFLLDDCLDGLRGIGVALSTARLEAVAEDSFCGLGRLIDNVAALAQAVKESHGLLSADPRFPKFRP